MFKYLANNVYVNCDTDSYIQQIIINEGIYYVTHFQKINNRIYDIKEKIKKLKFYKIKKRREYLDEIKYLNIKYLSTIKNDCFIYENYIINNIGILSQNIEFFKKAYNENSFCYNTIKEYSLDFYNRNGKFVTSIDNLKNKITREEVVDFVINYEI